MTDDKAGDKTDRRDETTADATRADVPRADAPPDTRADAPAGTRAAGPAHASPSPSHAWQKRARLKVLLVALAALALLGALVGYLSTRYGSTPVEPITTRPDANADAPHANAAKPPATPGAAAPETPAPTTTPTPTVEATPLIDIRQQPAAPTPSPATPEAGEGTQVRLVVPVAGVRAEDLSDTYTQARSEGRTHNAIDIIAPHGTPVVAAADGHVVKLFQSVPGGITVYQLATDNRTILYYAHLDRYADGLAEGHFARQGEVIGYVGDTGNAGPGNYHLHFSVSITSDPKRWYGGENVNPYPLLRGQGPGAGGQ